jgi:hypothetical protein
VVAVSYHVIEVHLPHFFTTSFCVEHAPHEIQHITPHDVLHSRILLV